MKFKFILPALTEADTRNVVFKPKQLGEAELKAGYDWSYREFYKWSSIAGSTHWEADRQFRQAVGV